MKKCAACLHENSDEMSFCLNCGKPLAEFRPPGWPGSESPTTALTETPTTVRRGSFETSPIPPQFTALVPPRSNKKLLVVLGGAAALLLLIFAAGAAIVGYNYYSRSRGGGTPTPVPTAGGNESPNKNSPTPPTNTSPIPKTSFTPPTQPTKTGTFTVFANGGWQLSDIDTVALEQF